jgi:hypothetical protein
MAPTLELSKRQTGSPMSFDPMAAAVDWLDAYRSGDLTTILEMYAGDATVHCGCGGMKTISGKEGLRAYWTDRVRDYPAFDLQDVQPSANGVMISYIAGRSLVRVVLQFNADGQIASHECGPSN